MMGGNDGRQLHDDHNSGTSGLATEMATFMTSTLNKSGVTAGT